MTPTSCDSLSSHHCVSLPDPQIYLQDDESLKHLTHEEKDVILFFEETLDSLEYDFDEPALCDSGIHCHSPQSLEESPSSHSEPEDVIDLVQPSPESLPDVAHVAGTHRFPRL